jgi:hypothetical protein
LDGDADLKSQISNLESQIERLGSGLPCLLPDLGFPEFESSHLTDFSIKAQFSKSVASTIPPRPLAGCDSIAAGLQNPVYR